MGFDVPKYENESSVSSEVAALTASERKLLDLNAQLNCEGQEKLTDYASDLVASGRYIKDYQLEMVEEA